MYMYICIDPRHAGPGCSSLGYGAMEEIGPFRVNNDSKTLSTNKHAWNNGKLNDLIVHYYSAHAEVQNVILNIFCSYKTN